MFDIEYKGGNGVLITTKKTSAIIDPKLSLIGLKDASVKNMLQIATEPRFSVNGDDSLLVIEGPGEYELEDFSIRGIAAQRHIDTDDKVATIYHIAIGEVRIALLGNIAPNLSDDQLEELGVVDIAIVPVGGGGYTLDAVSAANLVRKIDPKVVIPIHYADETLHYEVPQDSLESFVKELAAPVETVAKYKVKGLSALPAVLTVIKVNRS